MAKMVFFSKYKSLKNDFSSLHELEEAADFLDLLVLGLESGGSLKNSFDMALFQIPKNKLREEGLKVLFYCDSGMSFREAAFQCSQDQCSHVPFKEILEKLTLSLRLGTPILQNMTFMASHFRQQALTRLEELAQTVPVKMIFPLVFFLFPVIFILLGAGAINDFFQSFSFGF